MATITSLLLLIISCLFIGFTQTQQLNCPALPSRPTPTNVNDLHPNDIKVVMALGDSITAGFGMMGVEGGLDEFRGDSFSIGMNSNATAVPNFFKTYDEYLVGGSIGYHPVELCYGVLCPPYQYHPELDVFNAAQSGAMVTDLIHHELDYLLNELKTNPDVNMNDDWKLLTIFIGANDLCASCTLAGKAFLSPSDYGSNLKDVLERVRTNIPRVFVNLVQTFNLSQVYELSLKATYCKDVHRTLFIECDCLFEIDGAKDRAEIDKYCVEYNEQMTTLAAFYQEKNYTDFAVIVQPFGSQSQLENMPITILSDLDCFHPSLIAHEAMAIALWNNMITPAAQKKNYLDLADTPICPTNNTMLYTN